MNDHLRRILDEEERNRNQKRKMNRASLLVVVAVIILGTLWGPISSSQKGEANTTPEPTPLQSAVSVSETPWNLIVINRNQRLPEYYTAKMCKIGTEQVDGRIYASLTKLLETAAKDGISLTVCSGYRSVEEQDALFEKKVKEWMDIGLKEEASVLETEKYLQLPGASEHHTGLAVDLITDTSCTLDEEFAKTEAYRWLKAHAAEYGFIERYPKDKEKETGMKWESWHYRYVGEGAAKEIGDRCLEEYVEDKYQVKLSFTD